MRNSTTISSQYQQVAIMNCHYRYGNKKCHFSPKATEETLPFKRESAQFPTPITLPAPADLIDHITPLVEPNAGEPALPAPVHAQPPPEIQTVAVAPIQTHTVTRSGKLSRPPATLIDFPMVVYEATQDITTAEPDAQWMSPIAFAASSDPDVLYIHEAMQQKDKPQFITAMKEEVEGQTINGNWVLVEQNQLPPGTRILPCVWAM
jgi:hypothetical protein